MDDSPLLDDKVLASDQKDSFSSALSGVSSTPRPSAQPSSPPSPPAKSSSQLTVLLVFLAFVTLRAVDRVFNKRVQDRMVNYQLMYMNFLWPVGVQVMTAIMCVFFVWWQRRSGNLKYDWTFFLPNSKIASRRGPYPQHRLSLFSFWDELNAVGVSLPGPYVSLTVQNILTNLQVVYTLVISIFYLRSKYTQVHYIGCLLIIMSGLVSITVELQSGTGLDTYSSATGAVLKTSPLWYVIYIIGVIPAGVSNCYKEKVLKTQDLDIMYATYWSGYWQIVWGIVMFPINWINMPEPATPNPPAKTLQYLANTWTCFWGTAPDPTNLQDQSCAASGGSAAVWFMWYLLLNVSFNVLLLWLTKRMSATWTTLGTVLCLDLASLLSMSKALMGDEATPVTLEQYFGLILAGLGLWIYTLTDEDQSYLDSLTAANIEAERRGEEESAAPSRSPSFDLRSVGLAGKGRESGAGGGKRERESSGTTPRISDYGGGGAMPGEGRTLSFSRMMQGHVNEV